MYIMSVKVFVSGWSPRMDFADRMTSRDERSMPAIQVVDGLVFTDSKA